MLLLQMHQPEVNLIEKNYISVRLNKLLMSKIQRPNWPKSLDWIWEKKCNPI